MRREKWGERWGREEVEGERGERGGSGGEREREGGGRTSGSNQQLLSVIEAHRDAGGAYKCVLFLFCG